MNSDSSPKTPAGEEIRTADLLYKDSLGKENGLYSAALQEGMTRLADAHLLDSKELETIRAETAGVFHDLRADSTTTKQLHDLIVTNMLKPASEEQRKEWERESYTKLREKYGDSAKERLQAAKEFVEARPKLNATLNASGAGSNPKLVLELAEAAWRRKQGGVR
jgi:hypothetical protein